MCQPFSLATCVIYDSCSVQKISITIQATNWPCSIMMWCALEHTLSVWSAENSHSVETQWNRLHLLSISAFLFLQISFSWEVLDLIIESMFADAVASRFREGRSEVVRERLGKWSVKARRCKFYFCCRIQVNQVWDRRRAARIARKLIEALQGSWQFWRRLW